MRRSGQSEFSYDVYEFPILTVVETPKVWNGFNLKPGHIYGQEKSGKLYVFPNGNLYDFEVWCWVKEQNETQWKFTSIDISDWNGIEISEVINTSLNTPEIFLKGVEGFDYGKVKASYLEQYREEFRSHFCDPEEADYWENEDWDEINTPAYEDAMRDMWYYYYGEIMLFWGYYHLKNLNQGFVQPCETWSDLVYPPEVGYSQALERLEKHMV